MSAEDETDPWDTKEDPKQSMPALVDVFLRYLFPPSALTLAFRRSSGPSRWHPFGREFTSNVATQGAARGGRETSTRHEPHAD